MSDGPTDLKTYDVPDPPRPRGWKLRCLGGTFLGLLVAGGILRATELPHLAWVADNSSDFISRYARYRMREGRDPEQLRPYVLAIQDPATRGFFHQVLVSTKDPAQIEAMAAWLRTLTYWGEENGEVVESMVALDPERAAASLVAAWGDSSAASAEWQSKLAETIDERVPLEKLATHAVGIADPARRGRFHRALATTRDPKHIEAVFAYAATVVPTEVGDDEPKEWAGLVESLGAFGDEATPVLEKTLEQTESRALVSLAADALVRSDLPFLVKRARKLLDDYDQGVEQLALDQQLLSAMEDGKEIEGVSADDVSAARARLTAANAKAYMIFEVLRALERIRGKEEVDFCIVRGLSSFNRRIATWSIERIKERFSADQLVDTLFSYMAQKNEFMVDEVDLYEGLMKEMGPPGAARVAANLERLIGEAKGDPERVFWLYKKMGFAILRELGAPEAIPTLEKYASDSKAYTLTESGTDESGQRTRKETVKHYAVEVKNAIAGIQARANGGEGEGEGEGGPEGEGD